MATTEKAPSPLQEASANTSGRNDLVASDEVQVDIDDSVTSGGDAEQPQELELELAKKEDAWVWGMRLLVFAVLAFVAVAVCLTVYFQGRKAEQEDFEQDFEDLGNKLVTSFEDNIQQKFGIVQSFGMEISAHANSDGNSHFSPEIITTMNTSSVTTPAKVSAWPFVTLPDWTYRAQAVGGLAGISFMLLLPRVTAPQRDAWDTYSANNHMEWMSEGSSILMGITKEEAETTMIPQFPTIFNVHWGGKPKPEDGPGPYYPIWTQYPVNTNSRININMNADIEHQPFIKSAYETGKPAFERSNDYWTNDIEKDQRYTMLTGSSEVDYQGDPFAVTFFPVFDAVSAKEDDTQEVAALLLCIVYWRSYFDGLLPHGSDGIVVVLENTCNQSYTYEVDGVESHFIGRGDLHDSRYDYLEIGTDIDTILNTETAEGESGQEGCRYSIRVFPSVEFEESHYTSAPSLYAVVLASLFLFTSVAFFFYDCMVERRQTVVMKSAQQSGKVVRSLFPEQVREQLYQEQEAKGTPKGGWEQLNNAADNGIQQGRKAIASLYPETTVFFADLVGFTAWSSKRTPIEVFGLLEALYWEFDRIADRRKVYKIETIGDCYVAVTGLPTPQPDHALRMCRFARDCMAKMHLVTDSLAEKMGEDTRNLAMRVGLHSGPVTAGVLRGQKSRFQLFGDTVNTASRMESNGVKGRIHVSPATAAWLKSAWLTPREEKITVKGKGEMQTYFVDLDSNSSGSAGSYHSRNEGTDDGSTI